MGGKGFEIELELGAGLSASQQQAFHRGAERWSRSITQPLPSVFVGGVAISGLRISVRVENLDGPGRVWARGGPVDLRPSNAGSGAYLPATGLMIFDSVDLSDLEARGQLESVIRHEMGHVLGIGADVWLHKGLVRGVGTEDPVFTGAAAMREFGASQGLHPLPVPLENRGGLGVANVHWRESQFESELMSSYLLSSRNSLSRITLGALQDLGYSVDLSTADPFVLGTTRTFEASYERATHGECGDLAVRPRVLATHTLVRD